jgi:hypothetical protein
MTYRIALVATVFGMSFLATSATQQEKPTKPLTGIWEVEIPHKDSAVVDKRFVRIIQKGDDVFIEDLQFGSAIYKHEMRGGSVNFFVHAPDKSATVWLEGKPSKTADSMSGVITKADTGIVATGEMWAAARLGSVWACSNHDKPKHIAKSEAEMRDYSKKNGCMGWFRILDAVK